MQVKELMKLIDNLEKEMNWTKTSKKRIIEFIKQDARLLNERNIKHRGVDLITELLQLMKRTKIDIETEIPRHLKITEKIYKAGHVKHTN